MLPNLKQLQISTVIRRYTLNYTIRMDTIVSIREILFVVATGKEGEGKGEKNDSSKLNFSRRGRRKNKNRMINYNL